LNDREQEAVRKRFANTHSGNSIKSYKAENFRGNSYALELWYSRDHQFWLITYQGKIVDVFLDSISQTNRAFAILESGITKREIAELTRSAWKEAALG